MKIYLTATALLLSACASGSVQNPCRDSTHIVVDCNPFYSDCSCNQARDNGVSQETIAKPSKPKPPSVDPEEPEVDDHEPNIGEPGRWDWEDRHNQPSTRPDNDRNPDRAEGKPDRHNSGKGKGGDKGREHDGEEDDE